MSKEYDEETIAHMRELLLRGARMLDEHCPRCQTPLFLIKETNLKYCPKCRVYLATEEELRKAKIDLDRTPVYDFEEYWSKGGKERLDVDKETKILEADEAKKGIEREEETTLHLVNEILVTLLERLMIIIQRRDLDVDEILEIMDKLLNIRGKLEKKL